MAKWLREGVLVKGSDDDGLPVTGAFAEGKHHRRGDTSWAQCSYSNLVAGLLVANLACVFPYRLLDRAVTMKHEIALRLVKAASDWPGAVGKGHGAWRREHDGAFWSGKYYCTHSEQCNALPRRQA